MRQAKLLELRGHFGGEDGAGRGSVDDDVLRLVGLQQFLVDGDRVVDGGGKGMLGRQPVEHRHDLDFAVAGDGDRLGVGAGVGVEAAAVQVEQHLVLVFVRHASGVTMRTGTPAILSSTMVLGQSLVHSTRARAV